MSIALTAWSGLFRCGNERRFEDMPLRPIPGRRRIGMLMAERGPEGGRYVGTTSLVVWSGDAFGDKSAEGKYRLVFVTGLMSSTLNGPCHIIRRTPKFATRQVGSGPGGGNDGPRGPIA